MESFRRLLLRQMGDSSTGPYAILSSGHVLSNPTSDLSGAESVEILYLLFSSIPNLDFLSSMPLLRVLHLAKNEISASMLSNIDFSSLPNLQTLNLDYNPIRTIASVGLENLENLESLSLTSTLVSNLHSTVRVLKNLKKLKRVRFLEEFQRPLGDGKMFGSRYFRTFDQRVAYLKDRSVELLLVFKEVSETLDELRKRMECPTETMKIFAPTPIVFEPMYRDVVFSNVPSLELLDGEPHIRSVEGRDVEEDKMEEEEQEEEEEEVKQEGKKKKEKRKMGLVWREMRYSHTSRIPKNLGYSDWEETMILGESTIHYPHMYPLTSKEIHPRQLEFHPVLEDQLAYGTMEGHVSVINYITRENIAHISTKHPMDVILAISWLQKNPHLMVVGSDRGHVNLINVDNAAKREDPIETTYSDFQSLTSVHTDCLDSWLLISGYQKSVRLHDLQTSRELRLFRNIHKEHINVLKFSYSDPNFFLTSSFDGTVKTWDIRVPETRPVFSCTTGTGLVMACFSPNDRYILSSGVDNDVRQWSAVDGALMNEFPIRKTGGRENFTRSYYMNHGDYVVSGSCEQDSVRICDARSGEYFREVEFPWKIGKWMFVQSLRGNLFKPFQFSALLAFTDDVSGTFLTRTQLWNVDLLRECELDDVDINY